jgi:hypothetical protein
VRREVMKSVRENPDNRISHRRVGNKSVPTLRRDILMAKTTEDFERIEQRPEEHRQSLPKPQDQNQPVGEDQDPKSVEPYSPEIFLG